MHYALLSQSNIISLAKNLRELKTMFYKDEDYNDFLEKYRDEMNKYFNEIAQRNPQKQKFLRGWLNRANRAHLAR